MGMLDNRTADFMKNLKFFSGLPKSGMTAFIEAASVQHYPKGTGIFHQGDKADSFFVVISGWVRLFRNTIEGDGAGVIVFSEESQDSRHSNSHTIAKSFRKHKLATLVPDASAEGLYSDIFQLADKLEHLAHWAQKHPETS